MYLNQISFHHQKNGYPSWMPGLIPYIPRVFPATQSQLQDLKTAAFGNSAMITIIGVVISAPKLANPEAACKILQALYIYGNL